MSGTVEPAGAPVIPTRVFTYFALLVEKPGAPSLTLNSNEQSLPAFAIGEVVDVAGTVQAISGIVASIHTTIDVTRNGSDEIRSFTTRVVLA